MFSAIYLLFLLLAETVCIMSANAMVSTVGSANPMRPLPAKKQDVIAGSNIESLTNRAFDLLKKSGKKQIYIACVGAPGSGKSSICKRIVDEINLQKKGLSVVIPMDGYHIPQSELKMMGEQGKLIGDEDATSGKTTTYNDLMRRRGAPWTFDPNRLDEDLAAAREKGEGCFPLYDRSVSDPVANLISVTKEHGIILCEGNYLIAFDDPAWAPLQEHWDDQWYIDVPEPVLKERLVKRHLKNWNSAKIELFGEGSQGAEAKTESSDLKNARWVAKTSRAYANLIISN